MSSEEITEDDGTDVPVEEEAQSAPVQASPQARLRELLSIPDNQKTEAQWDELHELEIAMAQGGKMINFVPKQHKGHHKPAQKGQPQGAGGGKPQGGGQPHGGGQGKKHPRRFHKKPGKPAPQT